MNISAATGWHVERLVPAHRDGARQLGEPGYRPGSSTRSWQLVAATPPPMRGGKPAADPVRDPGGDQPPHFVLFTTGFLEETYRRFIERRLREEFGFEGTPIMVSMRLREKRGKGGGLLVAGKPAPARRPPLEEPPLRLSRRRRRGGPSCAGVLPARRGPPAVAAADTSAGTR